MIVASRPVNPWGVLGWALLILVCLVVAIMGALWGLVGRSAALAAGAHGAITFALLMVSLVPLMLGREALQSSSQKLAFSVLGLTFVQTLVTIAWIGGVVLWVARSPLGAIGAAAAYFAVLAAECIWATRSLRCGLPVSEVES